jgi:uncharacterized protein
MIRELAGSGKTRGSPSEQAGAQNWAMDARLVEFAEILRQNGVRVSTAEVQDAASALLAAGLSEPAQVRSALRATLIKREADLEPFARAF